MIQRAKIDSSIINGIIADYKGGLSTPKLSVKYKYSQEYIRKLLNKNGINTSRQKISDPKIIDLYNSGLSIKKISQKYRCTWNTINKFLIENKIDTKKQQKERLLIEDGIINDYNNGDKIQNILDKYGMNDPGSIYCILNKRNIVKRVEKCNDVDFDYILKLYQAGLSPQKIGNKINRSGNFIRKLLIKNSSLILNRCYKKNKQSKKHLTKNKISNKPQKKYKYSGKYSKYLSDIIRLYNNGVSPKKIGEILGIYGGTIYYIIKKHMKTRRGSWVEKTQEIISLYNSGLHAIEVGRKIGCSDVTVLRILSQNNIKIRPYTGKYNKQWKGGITSINKRIRNSEKNQEWKISCFMGSDRKSLISSQSNNLECHHIYGFQFILTSVLSKNKCLPNDLFCFATIDDPRFYDIRNGLPITKDEHIQIESNNKEGHPYWKVWKPFPKFALDYFPFNNEQYLLFNNQGQINPQNSSLRISNKQEIETIVRYEHYLGTVPPHRLILVSHVNNIITGVATFGQGANKNMSYNTWELTRLCVPYYVVRPFTIKFLDMCINYIKNNYPDIKRIISYADPNVGHDGAVYRMSGWIKSGYTQPSYCYFDPNINQLKHKSYCRRIKGIDKTEKELYQEKGLIKISLMPKKKYYICV